MAAVNPGSRSSDYFSTGSDAYVSKDRHTTFAEIYGPGNTGFNSTVHIKKVRAALRQATPPGVTVNLTGRDPLFEDIGGSEGPSIADRGPDRRRRRAARPAVRLRHAACDRLPLVTAAVSILTTFSAVWALTYVTHVSIVVAVPRRARRAGRVDRLLAADDLPLPRRAPPRPRRRVRARRDDDARRPVGRRLRLDRRDRPAQHGAAAAAVHPLDRDRGHADPRRRRGRHADADARAALLARAPDRQAARDPEADRQRRPGRGGLLAPLGRARRAPSASGRARRARARRPVPDPGREAEPGRGGGEEPAGQGRRVRRPRGARRRRDQRRA